MDDKERERRFRQERRAQMRRLVLVQSDTYAEILVWLKDAQTRIKAALADAPSDFESWRLTQLQAEVRRAMDTFERGTLASVSRGLDRSWEAGSDLVVQPLAAGGIDLAGQMPALDPRLLLAVKSFQTDRIKDISTTTINRVNQEIGQAAIGVQAPFEAARKVSELMDAPAARAQTIVRTELGTVYSEAAQQRMEQAKKLGVDGLQKQWRRSGKLHPRITHDLADGQIVEVEQPFLVGGIEIPKPRDPSIPASERINCGCTSLPFMKHWRVKTPGPRPYTAEELRTSPTARQVEEVRATQQVSTPAPAPPPQIPFHLRIEPSPTPLTALDLAGMRADAASWHRTAWAHVDPTLRAAIARKIDPPLLRAERSGAYARRGGGGIMISTTIRALDDDTRSVVWRHEFGHHLDSAPDRGTPPGPYTISSLAAEPDMARTRRRWEALPDNAYPDDLLVLARSAPSRSDLEQYWTRHGIDGIGLDQVLALTTDELATEMLDSLRIGDPESFLLAWAPRSPSEEKIKQMVSDFVEAVSQCRLAGYALGTGGHGEAYYAEAAPVGGGYTQRHALEAFANWVSIRSGLLQQVKVIVSSLAREAVEGLEKVLEGIANARS